MPSRSRAVLAIATKQGRKEQRQFLGDLKDLVINPSTERRYEAACRELFIWAEANDLKLPDAPRALI